jgi:hypothetical protein
MVDVIESHQSANNSMNTTLPSLSVKLSANHSSPPPFSPTTLASFQTNNNSNGSSDKILKKGFKQF